MHTTCSSNKAWLKRRSSPFPPPGRIHFDLIQGRIESAAVDEQNLSCMTEAHVPIPPKPPLLPRHDLLDLNQTEWQLTGFCMARWRGVGGRLFIPSSGATILVRLEYTNCSHTRCGSKSIQEARSRKEAPGGLDDLNTGICLKALALQEPLCICSGCSQYHLQVSLGVLVSCW